LTYLPDTNILIAITKSNPAVRRHLEWHADHEILLSSVVLAEIEYGIAKSAATKRKNNRQVFEELSKTFTIIPFSPQAAQHYGELRVFLEKQGTPIGPNDTLIAAEALAQSATLVTDNMQEFSRVPGLLLENWLRN